ncbi:MAG TPA: hypothetical protein VJW96_04595 [Terriglobales bacterium]|jgi:hypothetical protein|nr:hypothetical protein [Terriglobales bacterium]
MGKRSWQGRSDASRGMGWLVPGFNSQKKLLSEGDSNIYWPTASCTNLSAGEENNMKKLMALCFAVAILTYGVAVAQDTMSHDTMKADSSKAVDVKGKISDDGKTFVSDKDSKSWTIVNPEAVKGHEGHHVILNAHVYADKNQVHVMSLKMAK